MVAILQKQNFPFEGVAMETLLVTSGVRQMVVVSQQLQRRPVLPRTLRMQTPLLQTLAVRHFVSFGVACLKWHYSCHLIPFQHQ